MNGHGADLGQDAQGQGKLLVAAVQDLSLMDGHVPAPMRGQQLG
jgi:hypothetical protein